jgi:hypothetical protein
VPAGATDIPHHGATHDAAAQQAAAHQSAAHQSAAHQLAAHQAATQQAAPHQTAAQQAAAQQAAGGGGRLDPALLDAVAAGLKPRRRPNGDQPMAAAAPSSRATIPAARSTAPTARVTASTARRSATTPPGSLVSSAAERTGMTGAVRPDPAPAPDAPRTAPARSRTTKAGAKATPAGAKAVGGESARPRRSAAETAGLAARIKAARPDATDDDIAAELGISTARLRAVRRETA